MRTQALFALSPKGDFPEVDPRLHGASPVPCVPSETVRNGRDLPQVAAWSILGLVKMMNKLFSPVSIRLLSPQTVMFETYFATNLIQQSKLKQWNPPFFDQ